MRECEVLETTVSENNSGGVEGPWVQEDLYISRIYSDQLQDWMVLEVLSDIVKT